MKTYESYVIITHRKHIKNEKKIAGSTFNNVDNYIYYKEGMKLLYHSQTSMASLLKFRKIIFITYFSGISVHRVEQSSPTVSLICQNAPAWVCEAWTGILCFMFNKANLRDLIAATGLVISNWIQIVNFSARVTVKFDGWPCKTIGHLFYATSSFVHLFVPIGEFKLKLQSGNAQSGSNWMIFRAVRPWNLTDDLAKQ